MPCSVVIADARRLVRESLQALVESRSGLAVVGQAEDGRDLIDVCLKEKPDVAVVDAQLPKLSGIEALRRIRSRGMRPRFVLTSGTDSPSLVRVALLAGASAFVPKTAAGGDLLDAIEASHAGQHFFARCAGSSLRDALESPLGSTQHRNLTGRQVEVLQLVAEGLSTKQIASELGVSIKTAQTHRINLMKKVGAHKASELVRYAIREGIVEA